MASRPRRHWMEQSPGMVRRLTSAYGRQPCGSHNRLWLLCRFRHRPASGRNILRRAPLAKPKVGESVGHASLGPYVADKGFEGIENHKRWLECYEAQLIHLPKRNSRRPWSKRLRRWVAGIRQIVESVYDKLFNTFGLHQERPHELSGLRARLAARVALHNFCNVAQRETRPSPAVLRRLARMVISTHTKRLREHHRQAPYEPWGAAP